jgi:hypothetical protein
LGLAVGRQTRDFGCDMRWGRRDNGVGWNILTLKRYTLRLISSAIRVILRMNRFERQNGHGFPESGAVSAYHLDKSKKEEIELRSCCTMRRCS